MEQKLSQDNFTFSFSNVMFITAIITFILFTGVSIAVSKPIDVDSFNVTKSIPDVRPSTYSVTQLSITFQNTGMGLINLDGYLVPLDFKFDSYASDYGVKWL